MVKTVKFFCIAGIFALLILFVSYTETDHIPPENEVYRAEVKTEIVTESKCTENETEKTNSEIKFHHSKVNI